MESLSNKTTSEADNPLCLCDNMTHSSRRTLLENIRNSTKSFLTKLPCPVPSSTSNAPAEIPRLSLATRTSQFRQHVLESGLLPQICALTLSKAQELEKIYRISFEQACSRLVDLPRKPSSLEDILCNVRSTFETLYDQNLNQLLDQAKSAKQTHQSLNRNCGELRSRLAFRYEYSPILERYFYFNAYPSSADRTTLAFETHMSCRQIEVWFQNHRNRAKKEGKELRRSSDTHVLQHALDTLDDKSLERKVRGDWRRQREYDARERDEETEDEYSEDDNVCHFQESLDHNFNYSAPAHAFPNRYPPCNDDDPFPCTNGVFNFAPVQWERKPASSPPCYANLDMDDLAAIFSLKLNIRQEAKHVKLKKVNCGGRRQPWFSSLVTALQVAPHPAFLRRHSHSSYVTHSPSGQERPIQSPRPSSLYGRTCKALQLTKRIPAHPPMTFGAASFVSQSPAYQPLSMLSRSRFSSSSSLSSIEPSTPPLSPLIDPLPIISSEQDCRILDNPFPDIHDYISQLPPDFGVFLKTPPLCDDLVHLDHFSFGNSLTPQYSITA